MKRLMKMDLEDVPDCMRGSTYEVIDGNGNPAK